MSYDLPNPMDRIRADVLAPGDEYRTRAGGDVLRLRKVVPVGDGRLVLHGAGVGVTITSTAIVRSDEDLWRP